MWKNECKKICLKCQRKNFHLQRGAMSGSFFFHHHSDRESLLEKISENVSKEEEERKEEVRLCS